MSKIFLTGATGYIGGTVLSKIVEAYPSVEVTALVRNQEKAEKVTAKFPTVKTVIGDNESTELIEAQSALADVVVNAADADHQESTKAFIRGLEKKGGGYYIHTSGIMLVINHSSVGKVWDDVKDVEGLSSFPETAFHRITEKITLEAPPSVHTAIISPALVYGAGSGPDRIYTIPLFPNTVIAAGAPFEIGTESSWSTVHIEDLARLYLAVIGEALKPNGGAADWDAEGYYFGASGDVNINDFIALLGDELAKLGRIPTAEVQKFTVQELTKINPFFGFLVDASVRAAGSRGKKLGWKPVEGKILEHTRDTIRGEFAV